VDLIKHPGSLDKSTKLGLTPPALDVGATQCSSQLAGFTTQPFGRVPDCAHGRLQAHPQLGLFAGALSFHLTHVHVNAFQ
jgi:hypothetical protein